MKNSSIENKCTEREDSSLKEVVKEISSLTKISSSLDLTKGYRFRCYSLHQILTVSQEILNRGYIPERGSSNGNNYVYINKNKGEMGVN